MPGLWGPTWASLQGLLIAASVTFGDGGNRQSWSCSVQCHCQLTARPASPAEGHGPEATGAEGEMGAAPRQEAPGVRKRPACRAQRERPAPGGGQPRAGPGARLRPGEESPAAARQAGERAPHSEPWAPEGHTSTWTPPVGIWACRAAFCLCRAWGVGTGGLVPSEAGSWAEAGVGG